MAEGIKADYKNCILYSKHKDFIKTETFKIYAIFLQVLEPDLVVPGARSW